ncbi:PREDICTED: uncharacterized protein LOC109167156 [Ipomoea nil]|uniref:uncharacterized protein LOC109167156 n=1 Tax=Ipomoea nil TaxID=35883 RepID=UPI0009016762|nr:PREDICTED: uncharacterized protein LOC109167156 [Ipomoea nil]XP_019171651.1 PREDICTED: uncharacterized protein LOC109167156 [Ipomoea nil]XP_019171652.1 PREDICTED: uncharacterized protein LOC109167156 [Ipomoea nil]XP_019171653.1 PREDICTED: uncharacterized protein LOC109167156 [Ipomoea nil]XP_019171654.1 PREDICTED: uncharacterized protein LOC109167156 [Ipomoea nil]
MNEFSSERPRSSNIYTSAEPSPSQTQVNQEGPWKNFGTSTNAISFGFVATAILISMFLIMAIFEHLFKPGTSFSSPEDHIDSNLESGRRQKLRSSQTIPTSYSSDFTVLMPGQQYPTFIAQPAPLPCQRERVYWPSHEHSFSYT